MNMKNIEQKLRHADYKQAKLYFFCNFIALMIITAYALLMKSPTILTIYRKEETAADKCT